MKNLKQSFSLITFAVFVWSFFSSCASSSYGCPSRDYSTFNGRRHYQVSTIKENPILQKNQKTIFSLDKLKVEGNF